MANEEYTEIGVVINTHGVHGEIKVQPECDDAKFFKNFKSVIVSGKVYPLKSVKTAKDCAVLKLEGVDNLEEAEKLRTKAVLVPLSDMPEPPKGTYYVRDLEGLDVFAHNENGGGEELLGTLTEVMFTGANDVYAVTKGDKEYLIPAVKQFILGVDPEKHRMDIMHIRGITYDED